jgi:glycerophosphoryl diester phosphodiesterase
MQRIRAVCERAVRRLLVSVKAPREPVAAGAVWWRPGTVQEFLRLGGRLRVIAHRGLSMRAPENTVAAVEAAIGVGADMVEVDVATTVDGVAVCLHDATVDRTTSGTGRLRDLTWNEVQRLDAGSWLSSGFAGEPVPSVDEVLACARGRVLVNLELKPDGDAVSRLVAATVAAVRAAGMEAQVVVSSFDAGALEQVRETAPGLVTASLLHPERDRDTDPLAVMMAVGSRALNVSRAQLSAELVRHCHGAGRPVAVYTVNRLSHLRRCQQLGVHAVFTDRADDVVASLRKGGGSKTQAVRPRPRLQTVSGCI